MDQDPPTSTKPPPRWRRIIVRALLFGASFAVVAVCLVALLIWYANRPQPPAPWNGGAITATFNDVGTHKTKAGGTAFYFTYTLENHTDYDYNIAATGDSLVTVATLKRQNSISGGGDSAASGILRPEPVFLPAKQRALLLLDVDLLSYPDSTPSPADNASQDEWRSYRAKLAAYVSEHAANLDGFVIYDKVTRYQIVLPNGWTQQAATQSSSSSLP